MLRGHESLRGKCCFAANSFYCLRLPIHPLLEGGDPNARLGVIKVLRVIAASQQAILLSPAPHPSNARGRTEYAMTMS